MKTRPNVHEEGVVKHTRHAYLDEHDLSTNLEGQRLGHNLIFEGAFNARRGHYFTPAIPTWDVMGRVYLGLAFQLCKPRTICTLNLLPCGEP